MEGKNIDRGHDHFLNLTSDIGDPSSLAHVITVGLVLVILLTTKRHSYQTHIYVHMI